MHIHIMINLIVNSIYSIKVDSTVTITELANAAS